MKRLHLFFAVALVTMLCVSNTRAKSLVLRYKANAGDSNIYKMKTTGVTTIYVGDQTQMTTVDNEMFLKQTAKSFDEATKVVSYETKVASGVLKINGAESPMPMMGQIISTQMKNNGEFINAANAETARLNGAQLVFPDKEVSIGSQWSHTMPPNDQMPVPAIITFTVIGNEEYLNRNCVKISMTIKSDNSKAVKGISMDLSAKGVVLFDPDKGILVSNHVNSEMRMTINRVINGTPTEITTRMEMKVRMDLQV